MNILIDFTQIPVNKVGVGVYALNTFPLIIKSDLSNNYILLVQDDDKDFALSGINVKIINVKSSLFRYFPIRMLLEQFYIPYLVKKENIDIIHSLHYSFPLIHFGAKRVITIHDLTFFIYPQLHTFVKRYYFRWFIKRAAMTNNSLICVSQSTCDDLRKYVSSINSSSYVIPLAANVKHLQIDFTKITTMYSLPEEYILFIGTLEPRKNIEGLIRAYAKIANSTKVDLLIIGKKGWFYEEIFRLIREMKLEYRIRFLGFVEDKDKVTILSHAKVFIYPSFYEGFGLPVLEALSLGIPTITSNISSLPEVGEEAVIYINPYDIEDISENLKLLLDDKAMRESLSKQGLSQAAKFTWEITSNKTLIVYKKTYFEK